MWREEKGDSPGNPQVEPTFRFTGKPFDEETGLGYFGARYYDPRKARWLSVDNLDRLVQEKAVFDPPMLSVYLYSRGNPVKYIDPDGERPIIMIGASFDIPGGHLEQRYWSRGRGERTFSGDFPDIKNPDDKRAKRLLVDFLKTRYKLKDIDMNTDVVVVSNAQAIRDAIEQSGAGGSKVYLGHAGLTNPNDLRDPNGKATGLHPGSTPADDMSGEEFVNTVLAKDGNPVAEMCMGGTIVVDRGTEGKYTLQGPKDAVYYSWDYDKTEAWNAAWNSPEGAKLEDLNSLKLSGKRIKRDAPPRVRPAPRR